MYIKKLRKDLKVENPNIVDLLVRDTEKVENVNEATKMFIYLFFCPSLELVEWKIFLEDLFQKKPSLILMTLNRILKADEAKNDKIGNEIPMIMDKMKAKLNLQYKKLFKGDYSEITGLDTLNL